MENIYYHEDIEKSLKINKSKEKNLGQEKMKFVYLS